MRILIASLTALMVSVGFYGAMWLAMDRPDQAERKLTKVPLIKAEVGPAKQKPLNSGGLQIPNLDMLVFGLLKRIPPPPRKVTLAPLPEEPIELPKRTASAIEMPVPSKGTVSLVRDLKASEVPTALRRIRLGLLANQSSVRRQN